ncbi:MAG: glycosyltransferase family 4 protein, partial [Candidatus Hodarchaeota archaeon]
YHVVSHRTIQAAIHSKIDPYIITYEQSKIDNRKLANRYFTVKSIINPLFHTSFLPSIFWSMNDFLVSLKLSSQINFVDFDVIHILNINKEAYLLTQLFSRINKPILLHLFHSQYVLNDDVFKMRKIVFKLKFYSNFSNHTLTSNFSMYNFLLDKYGFDENRVHYVPIPVDTRKFKTMQKENVRKKYGVQENIPIVAYIGSLNPSRGLFYLIKSFLNVVETCPDSKLFISHLKRKGEESYELFLHQLVKKYCISDNVIIRGPSQYVEEIYNLADVVALPFTRPYWVDPPLVLLEAMSCGGAVISTSVGAINEIIKDDENGIMINPRDTSSLSNAIIKLFSSPQRIKRYGNNANKTIREKHAYKIVGKKLLDIYEKVQENQ